MNHVYRATVGAAGRVVIPAEVRRALQLKEGDDIVFTVNGDTARVAHTDTVLKEVQAFFREGIPDGVSLVDELLAERREDARREFTTHD